MPSLWLIRFAVAAVWLYEGLWCKVLGRVPQQMEIAASVPILAGGWARWFLPVLGYVEAALGLWLLTGWSAQGAALVTTLLLVSMNTVGLIFARKLIHDPIGMLFKNFVLVVLTWVAAAPPSR